MTRHCRSLPSTHGASVRLRRALHHALLLLLLVGALAARAAQPTAPLPEQLADTGLFEPGTTRMRADNLRFFPQYPLWSDGADKRRWIHLPPGSFIDATHADAWEFPIGTRLWKEFSHAGRPVETRLIERLDDGHWRYATYVWNAQAMRRRYRPRPQRPTRNQTRWRAASTWLQWLPAMTATHHSSWAPTALSRTCSACCQAIHRHW